MISGISLGVGCVAGFIAVDGVAADWQNSTVVSVRPDDECTFEWTGGQDFDYCPSGAQVGDRLASGSRGLGLVTSRDPDWFPGL